MATSKHVREGFRQRLTTRRINMAALPNRKYGTVLETASKFQRQT